MHIRWGILQWMTGSSCCSVTACDVPRVSWVSSSGRDFGLSPLTCCKNKSASTESSKTKGWILWVFHISTLLNMQHISTERHAHWLTITSRSCLYYQAKGNINEGIMSHVSPAQMTCFLSYCNSIFHLYHLCYVTEWPSLTR